MTETRDAPRAQAKPTSFRDIMALWPRLAHFAEAAGRQPYMRVYMWFRKRRIPIEHWPCVIAAVRDAHGIELTVEELHAMWCAVPDGRTRAKQRDAA